MRLVILTAAALIATHAAAQVRSGDEVFDAGGLAGELSGTQLEFYDGSTAQYDADKGYVYRYTPDDRPFTGTWDTNDDSSVCVTFDNGSDRCDIIVRAAGRLVLITEDGVRFPVREVRPAAP